MGESYAKLWRRLWVIADRKERNRRSVRPETYRGAVADLCISIDNSPDKTVTYNPRYWTARWEWRRIEVKRLLDDIIATGVFRLIKKPGEQHRRISLSESPCSQFVASLCQICSRDFEPWQGLKGQVVTSLCQICYEIVALVPTNPTIPKRKKSSASASPDAPQPNYITAKDGKNRRKLEGKRLEMFLVFWETFSLLINRAQAAWAWLEIDDLDGEYEQIITAARIEARRRPGLKESGLTPIQAPSFLSGERWRDEIYRQETTALPPRCCGTCMDFYGNRFMEAKCKDREPNGEPCGDYKYTSSYDRTLQAQVA